MALVITYCSAEKNALPDELAAVDRYASQRIRAVHDAARLAGHEFRILSGRFGLLKASTPIPDYDHLLGADEVDDLVPLLIEQLRECKSDSIFLVTRTLQVDPNIGPYLEAVQRAGINVMVHELDAGPIDSDQLAERLRMP